MIRRKTIGEKDRADRSIRDHMHIIEALEARDTVRAENWCATTRSALPSTSRNTPIIWIEELQGGAPWPMQQSRKCRRDAAGRSGS